MNGVKILSELSGLSEDEIQWTFNRCKQLKELGYSKDEQRKILKQEQLNKPWENNA